MAHTKHGTLAPNAVTSVTITPGEEGIVVVNRNLEGTLWVRIDGQNPVIGADDSYVVFGSREFPLGRAAVAKGSINVRLISDAGRQYSVEAIQ